MSSSGDYKYCVIQTIIVRIIHFDNFKYSTLLTSAVLDLKVNLSNMLWTKDRRSLKYFTFLPLKVMFVKDALVSDVRGGR